MQYFKDNNNNIFAYDDEQVNQGYGKDLTPITQVESDVILNPPKAQEEISEIARAEFKAERDRLVSELEITYNGVVYQADEVSQGRMSRAILALPDDATTTLWIASDNTPTQLTRVELSNMLRMAGEAQTAIWVG